MNSATQPPSPFVVWLSEQMRQRDLSQMQLAKRAGLSQGAISKVMLGHRQPGKAFCKAVARGLRLPESEVFAQAGVIAPPNVESPAADELVRRLLSLPPTYQERLLELFFDTIEAIEEALEQKS